MEDLVRQLIEMIYCEKYIGSLKASELISLQGIPFGWKISIGLHCDRYPLQIAYDGDVYDFLKCLAKRLRQDHLHYTDYFNGYKITLDPNLDPSTHIPPKDPKASII